MYVIHVIHSLVHSSISAVNGLLAVVKSSICSCQRRGGTVSAFWLWSSTVSVLLRIKDAPSRPFVYDQVRRGGALCSTISESRTHFPRLLAMTICSICSCQRRGHTSSAFLRWSNAVSFLLIFEEAPSRPFGCGQIQYMFLSASGRHRFRLLAMVKYSICSSQSRGCTFPAFWL